MAMVSWLLLTLSALVVGYLTYVILRPERF